MKTSLRHCVTCILGIAILVSVAWAGDVWKEKKPADWSQKDMEKFLTRSPWARTVQPDMPPPSTDQGPTGANTGGWGGGPGGGGGGGGAWGRDMGPRPIMTFQVRWASAPIMREALKVAESEPLNAAIAKYTNDYYIISVTMQVAGGSSGGGQWGAPGGRQWGGPGRGQPPSKEQEEGRKRFEASLIQGVMLKFGGKAVHPEKAQMTPCKAGMATLYLFPRSLKLEEAAKDYTFESSQGPAVTRASFNLKGFDQAPDKGL